MPQDILFVEDDRGLLSQYGRTVELALGIQPFLAGSGEQAIEILRTNSVKVVLIDQRMPGMNGTELARKIREELGFDIPCVMLTGFAHEIEAMDAVNLSFFRFIDKKDATSQLIPTIRKALDYQLERELLAAQHKLNIQLSSSKSGIFPIRQQVDLFLKAIVNIVSDYVPPDQWVLEYAAQPNITIEQEREITRIAKFRYETTIQASLLWKSGFSLGTIVSAVIPQIEGSLSKSIGRSYEHSYELRTAKKLTIHAISDSKDEYGVSLLLREYWTCPTYLQVNCILERICSCCQIPQQFYVSLNFPIGRLALRFKERFSDGKINDIDVGFLPAQLVQVNAK